MGLFLYLIFAAGLAGAVMIMRQCTVMPMPMVDCFGEDACAAIWAEAMAPYDRCRNRSITLASVALVGLLVKGIRDIRKMRAA